MRVFGNWDDLVEKCDAQDEELKRRMHRGQSWYDIITEAGCYRTLAQNKKPEDWEEWR